MPTIAVRHDVAFGDAGRRPLKLDLYSPGANRNGAAVVMLHGGAWRRGDKSLLAPHATALAEQGFLAVVPEYRLVDEAVFPAQIHDVRRALRWTRSHADELGFDPGRLCVEGHSAGGHLALLAASSAGDTRLDPGDAGDSVPTAVAAVAAVYPPVLFHLATPASPGSIPAQALPGADISDAMALLASPVTHIGPDHPPVMLLHGDADKVVPMSTSRRYEDEIRARAGKVDLHVFAGFPHGFANHDEVRPLVMTMIGQFFRRTAVEPDAFVFGPSRFEQAAARG
jgi:acetyl esterase/lipase